MSARLSTIMLFVRDFPRGVQFFRDGLGLPVTVAPEDPHTPPFAEVNAGPVTISLKGSENLATCSTGYSPMLQFEVDDMDATIVRALSLGGALDGPIKYPPTGKAACLRAPGGQMIGLFEPNLDLKLMQEAALAQQQRRGG
uniref:VOC domain-containing protein n=1 Tax=Hemiselmis tepida TaxID=464990 RepID=A0A7S0Z6T4_9CRYP|mmetsp:Transcript_7691/g.19710  ORF Transcript_7691/g.19710 Transcript_7691/m.19710 type:complete len:141 (+) Transcript_7691:61-483(+)